MKRNERRGWHYRVDEELLESVSHNSRVFGVKLPQDALQGSLVKYCLLKRVGHLAAVKVVILVVLALR